MSSHHWSACLLAKLERVFFDGHESLLERYLGRERVAVVDLGHTVVSIVYIHFFFVFLSNLKLDFAKNFKLLVSFVTLD